MLQVKRESQVTFIHSEALNRIPGIIHAFSTRRSDRNDFTLGPATSPNPIVNTNRVRFLAAMGAPGWSVMKLDQIHSGIVCDIDDTGPASEPMEGDAAVTSLQGVMLGIQTADCAPILIADREARAVGAVHAGWRGTALRIVESTIARIAEKFTIRPGDLTAAIGPHIGVCCYEVGEDVIAAIRGAAIFERRRDWEKPHLNLAEAARRQLLNAGVPEEQIETSSLCTRCRADLFFSYRREGTRTGRLLSVIGIVP